MAHIPHALGLPEVAFRVAQYLELDDFKACSLVCKAFHVFYAPYIWETIHIGVFSLTDKRTKRIQEPQARLISLETNATDHSHQQGQLSREERFLQDIQGIAPWILSLTIHSHHSPRQLRLGNQCTNISSLSITAPPFNEQFGEDYWNDCEALVLQNKTHLRSLTLVGWGKPCDNPQPTLPPSLWTPLITCAQHANLSELRIQDGMIRSQDSEAFWKVCEQLERLELTNVNLEELLSPSSSSSIGVSEGDVVGQDQSECTLINKDTTTSTINALKPTTARFPKLRKLAMANLGLDPPLQMEHFVLHCPMIQALNVRLNWGSSFPMRKFCDHFAAQAWPYLDALEISGQANDVSGQEHALILQSTKRQFKCLDLKLGAAEEQVFTLLRQGGHFDTLTKMDFTLTPHHPPIQVLPPSATVEAARVSKWIVEILESCRLLEHISGTMVHTQDVIDSKQWVCHGLKTFEVMINMDANAIKDSELRSQVWNGVDRTNRCRQIFERLSQLKRLRVLSMNWGDRHHWFDFELFPTLRPLPLELGIGLECLSTLTDLEVVGTHDHQPARMVDIEWMLEHWPKLRKITGGRPLELKLYKEFMKTRGVETVRCWQMYRPTGANNVFWEQTLELVGN